MPSPEGAPPVAAPVSRVILFFTVFIHLVGFGIIIPLLPYFAERYGAGGLMVGLLTTSFSLMQFLFAPLWGRVSDRIGRRPVLVASLVITGVSYLVFAAATSLPLLFASRMMAGAAGAILFTAQAYVADTTGPEARTRGMGFIGAAIGLGFIFGPAIGGLLSRFGFAAPAYAAAGLALAGALFAYVRLPESLTAENRAAAGGRRRAALGIREALGRPVVGSVLWIFLVVTLCFSGMEAILALFCGRFYGWGPQQLGYMFAYVGIVAAVVQVGVVGMLVRRFGERALVRAGLVLMGSAFVVAGLVPPLALFLVVMGIVSVGSGLMTPALSGLVSLATPAAEQGSVMGVYQSLGSLGRAAGPFLGGLAFEVIDPGAPLWMAGAALVVTAIAAARLPRR